MKAPITDKTHNDNQLAAPDEANVPSSSRRDFLAGAGSITGLTAVAGTFGLPTLLKLPGTAAAAAAIDPLSAEDRREQAFILRVEAALAQKKQPLPKHPTNGDEERYASRLGSYTKTLPHNDLGEVDTAAYRALPKGLKSGKAADFEAVPLGGFVPLANPMSAQAFQLEGADSHHLAIPPAPAFASEEAAGEMAELYWLALARDVPFSQYGAEALTTAAVSELSNFRKYAAVDAGNLFRGITPGDLIGPYVSQFLWQDVQFGFTTFTQQYRTSVVGGTHMTDFAHWLGVQRGLGPSTSLAIDPVQRYIATGRNLAEWVHQDFPNQAFLHAAYILATYGPPAFDENNPYLAFAKQVGFVTLGPGEIFCLVGTVTAYALKAVFYQQWSVHRRLRPEAFGGRVHNHKTGAAQYPIHQKLLDTHALEEVFNGHGSYLLPMAYPEGCPPHPAYPAAHGTVAGACATVLKAFFNESFAVANPKVATDDGLALNDYTGPTLTVGNELNKLAANVALGRSFGGVHWRSDCIQGLRLGEAVAIALLRDLRRTYAEDFNGFSLTTFAGRRVTV